MATQVQAGWAIGNIENVDTRLGPWATTDEFTGSVDITRRYLGMTIIVTGSGTPQEYWFKDGITNTDLEFKQSIFPYTGSATVSGSFDVDGLISAQTFSFSASQLGSGFYFASRPTGIEQQITLGNNFDHLLIRASPKGVKFANVPITGSIISLSLHLSSSAINTDAITVKGVEAISTNPGGTTVFVGGSGIITQLVGNAIYLNAPLSMSATSPITASGGITGSLTGSLLGTASWATNATNATNANDATSASYALTASYVESAEGFPFEGDAVITGSLLISGGAANGSLTATTITASGIISSSNSIFALNATISKSISAEGSITTNDFIYLNNGKSIIWDNGGSNESSIRGVANRYIFNSGSSNMVTISSSGIYSNASLFATLSADTDNTVVIYKNGELKTDEIDSRVWGSSLVGGGGTSSNLAYWLDGSNIGDSNFYSVDTTSGSLIVQGKGGIEGTITLIGRRGTGEVTIDGGSITSSGDISSSGDIYADGFDGNTFVVSGISFADFNVDEVVLGNQTYHLLFKGTGYEFTNPITASLISASTGITSSLYGTSSWAISSSHAITASYAANATTPTLAQVTSEGASTTTPITASIISASSGITGSLYGTSSWATDAITASYAANASTPTLQQVTDEGASTTTSITASIISASGGITGSLYGTSSWATNAVNADDATSASYALSASYASNATQAQLAASSSGYTYIYNLDTSTEHPILFGLNGTAGFQYIYKDGGNNITYNPNTDTLTVPNVAGTSSWATNAVNADDATSASYALSASYASNASTPTLQQVTTEGSESTDKIIADSFETNNVSPSYTAFIGTSSWATNAVNADDATSASYALTASYADDADTARLATSASNVVVPSLSPGSKYIQLATVTEGISVPFVNSLAQLTQEGKLVVVGISSSAAVTASGFLGDLTGTASYATTASYALSAEDTPRIGSNPAANGIAIWEDSETIGADSKLRFNGNYFDINSFQFTVTASTGDVNCGDIKADDINAGTISASAVNAGSNVNIGKTGININSLALPAISSNNYVVWAGGKTGQIGYRVGTSRRETKYDINPVSQELVDGINQLQPVTYIYKADEEKRTVGGFIAEEVAEVNPLFAKWGPNYKVNDSGSLDIDNILDDTIIPSDIDDRTILAAAVAKIQQLEKEIQELKAKIT